jgi:hypothetical protein
LNAQRRAAGYTKGPGTKGCTIFVAFNIPEISLLVNCR